MRQIDMIDIDANVFVEELKSFNASIVMVNVGGIIASYPTELEDEFQSEYLQGDSLAKISERCHAENIKVLARMDFSKVREPIYQRHPDWAYRTKSGDIVNYNGDVHACICGGYQQHYIYKIVEEVIRKLPIDGMFFNMGGFKETDYSYNKYGICHCENCQRKFKELYGLDLPQSEDMKDPVFRKYLLFKERVTNEENERMAKFINGLNPNIAVDSFDFKRLESNTEIRRPLPYFQYSASSNSRMVRGISNTVVPSNCSVDFVGFFYRHIAVSAAQQKLRLYQSLANLGGLDYYLIGRLDNHLDKTGYAAIKEVFTFHKNHEAEYARKLESIAEVLLVKSKIWELKPEERGWVRALTESHVLFDEVLEEDLLGKELKKYKTVIIPYIEKLSSKITKQLEAYAEEGGIVIVVGNSGKYDENYDLTDFPLRKILGVSKMDYVRNNMESSMLKRTGSELEQFPSMADTEVLMLGDSYLYAEYEESTKKFLSLIPPHMYGPPERCYFTQVTGNPGLTVYRKGKGLGVFIPWLPGTLLYREGYDNTFFFMKDVISTIAGSHCMSEELSPMVEVTLSKAADDSFMLLQLVNNSGHFGTSYMKPLAVDDIKLVVPCKKKITKALSLVSDKQLDFIQDDEFVTLVIPKLFDFESIRLQ
jgi:hypothetical protein